MNQYRAGVKLQRRVLTVLPIEGGAMYEDGYNKTLQKRFPFRMFFRRRCARVKRVSVSENAAEFKSQVRSGEVARRKEQLALSLQTTSLFLRLFFKMYLFIFRAV